MADPVLPQIGPCISWITAEDVMGLWYPDDLDVSEEAATTAAEVASETLYLLSGSQFSGQCGPVTVRPIARPTDADTRGLVSRLPAGYIAVWGWSSAWGQPASGAASHYGTVTPPEVELGAYPVTQVQRVKLDGVLIPPNEYYLQNYRKLVRRRPSASQAPTERYGWPTCLAPGTLVLTDRGQVPVELVREGDRVLTHRNRWRKVLWAGQTGTEETVVLRGRGARLRMTPGHRVWSAEVTGREVIGSYPSGTNRYGRRKIGAPEWLHAGSMAGSVWATPRQVESLPIPLPGVTIPENFWWLVGRWIGDGWTEGHDKPSYYEEAQRRQSHGVLVCCGAHEEAALETALAQTGWHWRKSYPGKNGHPRFRMGNKALWTWLREHFGVGAHQKRLPSWLFGADEKIRAALLEGYVSADGCRASRERTEGRQERRPFVSCTTVSRELAVGIRLLAATLGWGAQIYEGIQREGGYGRAGTPVYRIDWPEAKAGEDRTQSWDDGDWLWGRVRSVTADGLVVPVYNLEVEEDHSFVADGIVLKNTQIMDLPDTEPGTFSVTYLYGSPPPAGGILAAKKLAQQLVLNLLGQNSAIPQRATGVTRAGTSIRVTDVADFLAHGLTGIYEIDLFVKTWNPGGSRRRPLAWSPDASRPRRTPAGA